MEAGYIGPFIRDEGNHTAAVMRAQPKPEPPIPPIEDAATKELMHEMPRVLEINGMCCNRPHDANNTSVDACGQRPSCGDSPGQLIENVDGVNVVDETLHPKCQSRHYRLWRMPK